MASKVTRIFTRIAGLPVCAEPHKELTKYYGKILRGLDKMPKESAYRVQTEELIKQRKRILETTPDPVEVENKIGAGICEELIEQAKHELRLVNVMQEYKPWEPVEEKPSPEQWKWPIL